MMVHCNMYSHELDKWWDTFSNVVSESRKKSKGKVRILITAKENVIDKACQYMRRRTSVFREKFFIRTEKFELSSEEKEAILDKQIEYAKTVEGLDPPKIDPDFIRKLKNLKSVIGFPLCAHLYACVKDYRDSGIHFFQEPIQYIRRQIKYEIDVDRTDKVKSLFLVMFLHQIQVDTEGVFDSISLKDPKYCVRFLKEHYPGLIDDLHLRSNSFTKLSDVANEIMKINLITPVREGVFAFKHQTICQAVGHYFFTEHFDEVLKYFPVNAFVCEEFVCREEKEYDDMASRLYREVEKGNHSKVFSCRVFMNRAFGEHFCSIIENSKNVRRFLLVPGDHSLPITFWVRKNHLFHLSASIQSIIERHANKHRELYFYLELFGECCADDENLLKKTDTTSLLTLEEAKTAVLNYRDGAGKSIIHIIVSLEIPDIDVSTIVVHLLRDMEKHPLYTFQLISSIREESLLTALASHNKNSRVLTILTLLQGLNSLNVEGYLLIFNTVSVFSSYEYHSMIELEVLLRTCIILIYCNCESMENRDKAVITCKNMKYQKVTDLLSIDSKQETKMSASIDKFVDKICTEKCAVNFSVPNPMNLLSSDMMASIRKCIQLLGKVYFKEINF
ncbi:uncharacterized protein LOC133204299 [Saccostrea echinata]|uniref:uncharacterized protein LOC133204299 n=1 Tax=Saccostrea echinata TaxID=191078 RepID=UPI002A82FED2|nr:uncharacterized protein LOC133204299 [Saccostrea echinata]